MLVACNHRGPLATSEMARLLSVAGPLDERAAQLVNRGWLERRGQRLAITRAGTACLDEVVAAVESQLTPDSPAYERRYRRETPTLPFDANTIWAEAICVNVRIRPDALRPLIPRQFDLDLYDGWAFVSLTASRLKDFGVGLIPRSLRMNFYQATYRAHVTFTDFRERRLRGCYFVRSETNSRVMSLTANLLPEFKAHHCSTYPIVMAHQGDHLLLSVDSGHDPAGKVVLVLDASRELAEMPPTSLFRSVADAYGFIVDFYDAFSYDPDTGEVFLLRIERGDWDIRILAPVDYFFGFFSDGPFPPGAAELDSVFYFRNTPYRWLPLVRERVAT